MLEDYLVTDYQKKIFKKRYAQTREDGSKETLDEMFYRVSEIAVKDQDVCGMSPEVQKKVFYNLFAKKHFIAGGRILSNAGGTGNGMLGNCFVVPISDSRKGIMKAQADTFEIYAWGGGVGTNFSSLRPKGAVLNKTKGEASGPCSFMDAFDHYADTIKQGSSKRRAAKMSILNVDHPDILEFIAAKTDHKRWKNTNVSVGITDAFMIAVENDDYWNLVHNNKIYKTVKAKEIWNEICRCAWQSAEPGVIFLDTLKDTYSLKYKYKLNCTNPCFELPLPDYGMCLLGSMILSSFITQDKKDKHYYFNWEKFKIKIREAVIYLDSLIDVSTFPIPETKEMMLKTRPIGLGITGLADTLFLLGLPYGDCDSTLKFIQEMSFCLYTESVKASEKLAKQFNSFEDYDKNLADFPPRRNSTLISYAPTGTISGLVGCSYGIEPHFAPIVSRNEEIILDSVSNSIITKWMKDNNKTEFPEWTRFAGGVNDKKHLVLILDHLNILKVLFQNVDNSISKTINLPYDATITDIEFIYKFCWENKIKGCTVYRNRCREDQPIKFEETVKSPEKSEHDQICDDYDIEFVDYTEKPKKRESTLEGKTYRIKPNPNKPWMYITINDSEDFPAEIFFKSRDATHQEYLDVISDMMTSSFRRGEPLIHVIKDLIRHESPSGGGRYKGQYVPSVAAGIGLILKEHMQSLGLFPLDYKESVTQKVKDVKIEENGFQGKRCPECGEYKLIPDGGCDICLACGYSACD